MVGQAVVVFCLLLLLTVFASVTATVEYERLCDSVFCKIVSKKNDEILSLKKIVDDGSCIPRFGLKADTICNAAIEEFALSASLPDDDHKENEVLYGKKIEDLERILDAPLHVLYLKQLTLARERALRLFRQTLATSAAAAAKSASNNANTDSDVAGNEFEAMMHADEVFRKDAEEYTRASPEWSYSKDAQQLKQTLQEVVQRIKKIQEVKLQAAKQSQQAMSYLQMQQQQLQAIQQQVSGGGTPWNVAMAYRIPDSNLNLNVQYQQGRSTVQLSCVPDEAMSLLGPNGFVHGVTPGNVGISVNFNI